jgi:hypothetical protein
MSLGDHHHPLFDLLGGQGGPRQLHDGVESEAEEQDKVHGDDAAVVPPANVAAQPGPARLPTVPALSAICTSQSLVSCDWAGQLGRYGATNARSGRAWTDVATRESLDIGASEERTRFRFRQI